MSCLSRGRRGINVGVEKAFVFKDNINLKYYGHSPDTEMGDNGGPLLERHTG